MGQRKNRMRSAARIADESARKSSKTRRRRSASPPRRVRESTAPQKAQRSRKKSQKSRDTGKKSSRKTSSRTSSRRSKNDRPARGEFYKTLRLAIVVFAMAAIGFLVVVGLDTAGKSNEERRTQYVVNESVKEVRAAETPVQEESAIGMFFTKLVDRFLDNDLPIVKKKAKKAKAKKAKEKPKAVVKKEVKPVKEAPKSTRSDKKAPRAASTYNKEVKPLKVAEQKRVKEKRSQRDRLNAILKSVGVEEARAAAND